MAFSKNKRPLTFIQAATDYAEPLDNVRIIVKEYVELMEEKRFVEACALAVSMVELSSALLTVTQRLVNQEKANAKVASEESAG